MAETAHHELWQRAGLTAALVGRDAGKLEDTAAALERHVLARVGDGARCERVIHSSGELLG